MDKDWSAQAFQDELARLPQGEQLAQVVKQVTDRMVGSRRRDLSALAAPLVPGLAAGRLDNQTTLGDAVAVLERGPQSRSDQVLLGALLARAVASSPPAGVEAEDRAAGELLWLAAHGGVDAFASLDAALGPRASGLWGALCDLVRRIERGREAQFDRADALTGALALREAGLDEGRAAARRLADEVEDTTLRDLLRGRGGSGEASEAVGAKLTGEMQPAPRSTVVTVLMAVTGLLLIEAAGRWLARAALQRRQPAELEVTSEGVRIRTRTEMLGRVLREAEYLVPRAGLAVASREVRFPRLALYAGLLALALGSYVGASLLGDGFKAASPSLLGQGLLVVALGIAIELAATALVPGTRGRCRVVLVPRKGAALCVGEVDAGEAQRTLASLRG